MTRLQVLDLDLENRPLSYLGSDYTTGEITAIAWGWNSDPETVSCEVLTKRWPGSAIRMLKRFLEAYNQADIVTGHYILGHDLPVINAACLELGLPPLRQKLVQDTKVHLTNRKYLSASQESLAGVLGCRASKFHMTQPMWREANRLTPAGIALTRERCTDDVVQHMELRSKLLDLHWLGRPRPWKGGSGTGPYVP